MDNVKQLTHTIFSQYQEEPVPIDLWLRKKSGNVIFVPERGILMYYDRIMPSNRLYELDKKSTHIWLCGVIKENRKSGVTKAMLRSMLSDSAHKCQNVISTHINRKKFPEMVQCLEHLGFNKVDFENGKNSLERFEIKTILLQKAVSNIY